MKPEWMVTLTNETGCVMLTPDSSMWYNKGLIVVLCVDKMYEKFVTWNLNFRVKA